MMVSRESPNRNLRPALLSASWAKLREKAVMRKLATLTGVAALAAGFVLAGPGHVMADPETICDDSTAFPGSVAISPDTDVVGNVIVPGGAVCSLLRGTVSKDIKVLPGGALDLRATNVGENIQAESALWIILSGATSTDPFEAGSDVQIKGTTGVPGLGTQFDSNVDLDANFICNGIIGENLQLEENATPFVVGDNAPPFSNSNCGFPLAVGKDLQAYKNTDITVSESVRKVHEG